MTFESQPRSGSVWVNAVIDAYGRRLLIADDERETQMQMNAARGM
jgi:hypothetical protein